LVKEGNSTLPGPEWHRLDDDVIKAIEEALQVDVPVDSKLLYRDSSPRFTREHTKEDNGGGGSVDYDDPVSKGLHCCCIMCFQFLNRQT
jgi:hypothetical protein